MGEVFDKDKSFIFLLQLLTDLKSTFQNAMFNQYIERVRLLLLEKSIFTSEKKL